jgi:hypothetical protein
MAQMRTSEPDESQLMFLAFDLLHQDGLDLRGLPLAERRLDLERLSRKAKAPYLRLIETFPDGEVLFEHCNRFDFEGHRTQPADLHSAGRPRASKGACRSRTNANDRLPRASLGRVEGGDGIVEGRDGADVPPQSSVPHPLDDLTQLGTIGLDNEVDRRAALRLARRWTPVFLRLESGLRTASRCRRR